MRLNGRAWHYFDEKMLFLPNAKGDYRIEVTYGKRSTPAIGRTHALIAKTALAKDTFTFEASLPEYQKKLPPSVPFYATILHDKPLKKLKGAKIANEGPLGTIISFRPGKVSLFFLIDR